MSNVPPDLKIAQAANKLPIGEVAADLGIADDDLLSYGHYKARISYRFLEGLDQNKRIVGLF